MINQSFYKLPKAKQKRILDCAARAFAKDGYHKANVNELAEAAEISVGSLYSYFDSKEDMFDAVFERASQLTNEIQARAEAKGGAVYDKLVNLFADAALTARRSPSYIQVYLSLQSPGMEKFAELYAPKLESAGMEIYRRLLLSGVETGELRPDIDVNAAAYLIDNTLMALYGSAANKFFKIHRDAMLGDGGRITRERASLIAARVLSNLFAGLRAPR